jgi:hypothetical protein
MTDLEALKLKRPSTAPSQKAELHVAKSVKRLKKHKFFQSSFVVKVQPFRYLQTVKLSKNSHLIVEYILTN